MLTIRSDSWHFRIYRWWWIRKYDPPDGTWMPRHNINLCPYMRVILFWSWLRWLFTAPTVGAFTWGFILSLPIVAVAKWADDYTAMALGYTGILVVYWIAFMLTVEIYIETHPGCYWSKRAILRRAQLKSKPKPPDARFMQLLGAWMSAMHRKVCPLIKVDDSNSREN